MNNQEEEKAMEQGGNNAGGTVEELLQMGENYLGAFNSDKALELYCKAAKLEPKRAEVWSGLASVCEYLEEFDKAQEYYLCAVKLAPKNPGMWSKLANFYEDRGLYDKAREAFETELQIKPDSGPVHFRLSVLYLKLKMPERALEFIRKAQSIDPVYKLIAQNVVAKSLIQLGRYGECVDALTRHLAETGKDDDDALRFLGDAYLHLGQDVKALEAYGRALRANPHVSAVWFNLGCVLWARGERKKSLAAHKLAVKCSFKSDALYMYYLGQRYACMKKIREAAVTLDCCFALDKNFRGRYDADEEFNTTRPAVNRKLKNKDRLPELHELLDPAVEPKDMVSPVMTDFSEALELAESGKYDDARKFLDDWLDDTPCHLCGWNILGQLHFLQGNYEECIKCKDKFISFSAQIASKSIKDKQFVEQERCLLQLKKGSGDKELADVYVTKAKALMNLGRDPEAEINIDNALSIDPQSSDAWAWKADLLSFRGKKDECIKAADLALSYNPDNGTAMYYKGKALMDMKKYKEAFPLLDKSMLLDPDDPIIPYGCGGCMFGLGRWREALSYLSRALEICPTFKDAWYLKHLCHKELGEEPEAKQSLLRWTQVQPDAPHGKTNMAVIVKNGKELLQ